MCNFRVGQKVVRVGSASDNASIKKGEVPFSYPKKGDVVTIRSIRDHGDDRILLTFQEHDNSHLVGYRGGKSEPGFHYSAFRPVVTRKTDISIFKAMLNPHKQEQNA